MKQAISEMNIEESKTDEISNPEVYKDDDN